MSAHSGDWTDDDVHEFVGVCARVEAAPLDVLAVMFSESEARATAHNVTGGNATGLIQFMEDTRKNLGFRGDWHEFAALGVAGQLPYVERYLAPHKGKLTSAGMVYLCVFLPACLTWPRVGPTTVVTAARGPFAFAYLPNKVFDRENRGYITVQDLTDSTARASHGPRWEELSGRVLAATLGESAAPLDVEAITEREPAASVTEDCRPVPLYPDPDDDVKPPPEAA